MIGASAQGAPYRINVGGPAYTDSKGNVWEADTENVYYDQGSVHKAIGLAISNTADDTLYQSERWGAMSWEFPITPGDYEVKLHWAEVYGFTTGQRRFDVKIEDDLVLDNFDIYAAAGDNAAWVETFPVTVTDNKLTIDFVKVNQQPKICAIEVLPRTALFRVNAGSSVDFTDSQGRTWESDTKYVQGGLTYSSPAAVAGTNDLKLFQTERYKSDMAYKFANIPNGSYEVVLCFAEVYSGAAEPGKRVFDVLIEGATVLDNYDITDSGGGAFKATSQSFTVNVEDNELNISFKKEVENPKVSQAVMNIVAVLLTKYCCSRLLNDPRLTASRFTLRAQALPPRQHLLHHHNRRSP